MMTYLYLLMSSAVAFAVAAALTPGVCVLARRWGAVAQPKKDRWHKRPTAMLGGVAILVTVAGIYLTLLPQTPETGIVLGAAALLWGIGLLDDLIQLRPAHKLAGQIFCAALLACCGLHLPWTTSPLINGAVTIIWLVSVTNAVNLVDNMDGLAAGIGGVGAAFLAAHLAVSGEAAAALMAATLAGALLGFLLHNAHPASIFMGDCGSMFIGFILAGAALLRPEAGMATSFAVAVVPLLILCAPLLDLTVVVALRVMAGRPIWQGGRDHLSHRLVALGLSQRRAVWILYCLAAIGGVLSFVVYDLPPLACAAVVVPFTVAMAALAVYVAGARVYPPGENRNDSLRCCLRRLFSVWRPSERSPNHRTAQTEVISTCAAFALHTEQHAYGRD